MSNKRLEITSAFDERSEIERIIDILSVLRLLLRYIDRRNKA